jgi:hypothetical protein
MMRTETIDATSIITVDYGKSLQEMIASGHYDWINDDITPKRFPITGSGTAQLEVKLFHFDWHISSEGAVGAIKADDAHNPWEPAKIEHLLAYGAKNPDEQRKYPIIALGSVAEVGGSRGVSYLCRLGVRRSLNLGGWVNVWDGRCRFLAVRNLSSAA